MGRSFLYGNVPSVIIDKCPCGVTVARIALIQKGYAVSLSS